MPPTSKSHRFGDLDGVPIDRAVIRLSGGGTLTRKLAAEEPVAFIVYGHAGLPTISTDADDELVRSHPLKPHYVTELTPELLSKLAGKRTTHTIIDEIRKAYDLAQGVARLPIDGEDEAEDEAKAEEPTDEV